MRRILESSAWFERGCGQQMRAKAGLASLNHALLTRSCAAAALLRGAHSLLLCGAACPPRLPRRAASGWPVMDDSNAAAGGGDDLSRKLDATQPEHTGYTPPKKKPEKKVRARSDAATLLRL